MKPRHYAPHPLGLRGATLMLAGLLAAGAAPAAVHFVAPDGDDVAAGLARSNAWRTLQHAVDHVRPGDTILVAAGTYAGVRIQTSRFSAYVLVGGEAALLASSVTV